MRLSAGFLAVLLLAASAAGCAGTSSGQGTTASASSATATTREPAAGLAAKAAAAVGRSSVPIAVPRGASAPFDRTRLLSVPSGWHAELWARVDAARFATWTPQGALLVSSAGGDVVELTPAKGMRSPRERVLLSGLNQPQGLAFDRVNGAEVLYVAEADKIDRYAWHTNGTVGARKVIVSGLPAEDPTGDDVHLAKSLVVGRDHTLYVTAGSASNASPNPPGERLPRASILAFAANGSHGRVFASGVRNGEGLSFAPDGSLWTAVNERDEDPYPYHRPYEGYGEAYGDVITSYVNEHPPDELARLTPGRNLGWPYCNPNPDVSPGAVGTQLDFANMPFVADARNNPSERELSCTKLQPIERGVPAHSAPLGFHFLAGTKIAAPWSQGAVLAVHGSWDRTPPRAPAVLWLPWEAAHRTLGAAVELVGGFQEQSGKRWGRPADAVVGPDGSLYVTDDTAGAVYRIGPRAG